MLIRKAPFIRFVKEILHGKLGRTEIRMQCIAVEALQEAAEYYITNLLMMQIYVHYMKKELLYNQKICNWPWELEENEIKN